MSDLISIVCLLNVCCTCTVGTNKLESVVLNKANFEALAKELLLVRCYRIEVYRQNKSRSESGWTLAFKVSELSFCLVFCFSIYNLF